MKKFILLASLIFAHQTFALDLCKFEDTAEFSDAVEAKEITLIQTSSDHENFSVIEKKMIHATLNSDGINNGLNLGDALRTFGDFFQDEDTTPGSNAGNIEYYQVGSYKFALVHFWPGDNEVGAFVEVDARGNVSVIASVSDQWISCNL